MSLLNDKIAVAALNKVVLGKPKSGVFSVG